jgi:hypothetical protein
MTLAAIFPFSGAADGTPRAEYSSDHAAWSISARSAGLDFAYVSRSLFGDAPASCGQELKN